jgi:hypothetical protein
MPIGGPAILAARAEENMSNSEEPRHRQTSAAEGDEVRQPLLLEYTSPPKTLPPPSPAPSSRRTLLEQAVDSVPTLGFLGLRRMSRIEEVAKEDKEDKEESVEPSEPEDP